MKIILKSVRLIAIICAVYLSSSLTFAQAQRPSFIKDRKEVQLDLRVIGGIVNTSLRMKGSGAFADMASYKYPSSLSFFGGFGLNAQLLQTSGLRLSGDIVYSAFQVEGSGAKTKSGPHIPLTCFLSALTSRAVSC